jgi:hypothetical protein
MKPQRRRRHSQDAPTLAEDFPKRNRIVSRGRFHDRRRHDQVLLHAGEQAVKGDDVLEGMTRAFRCIVCTVHFELKKSSSFSSPP